MKLLFFGRLRDGAPSGPVPPGISDVEALRAWLGQGRPELLDATIRIAVNDEMILGNRALGEGDEVAFLPPMSGGRLASRPSRSMPPACSRPFRRARRAPARSPRSPGRCAARGGAAVAGPELDHHPRLTGRGAGRPGRPPVSDHRRIVHRQGALAPGEAIVVAAAAAPHRRAAFDAAQYVMDRLKTEAPFWKREQRSDGTHWLDARDSDRQARARWS